MPNNDLRNSTSTTLPPRSNNHRRLGVLIITGIAILAASLWTGFNIPVFNGLLNFREDGSLLYVSVVEREKSYQRFIAYDPIQDQISCKDVESSRSTLTFPQFRSKLIATRLVSSDPMRLSSYNWKLVYEDDSGFKHAFNFSFPASTRVIGEKLVAGYEDGKVIVLNLADQQVTTVDAVRGKFPRIVPIDQTGSFLLKVERPNQAELLHRDPDGNLRSLWKKPLLARCISVREQSIYLIGPEATHVECYSAVDGSLISRTPFPEQVQSLVANGIEIYLNHLTISFHDPEKQSFHYRLSDFEKLDVPQTYSFANLVEGSDRLVLISNDRPEGQHVSCIDLVQNKEIWNKQFGQFRSVVQLPGSLHFLSKEFGATIDHVDVESGNALLHRQPFAWFAYTLPLLVLAAAAWAWHVGNQTGQYTCWLGLLALSTMFLAPLLGHLLWWTYYLFPTVTHQYLQGYFVASSSLTLGWTILGKGRLVHRLIPFSIVVVSLVMFARITLSDKAIATEAIVTTLMCSFPTLLLFAVQRWLGARNRTKFVPDSAGQGLTIRDLFIAAALIAMILAAAAPLIRSTSFPQGWSKNLLVMSIGELCMLAAVSLIILVHGKGWNWVLIGLISLLVISILFEALFEFVTGYSALARESYSSVLFRVFATTVLVFAFQFRVLFVPNQSALPIGA